MRNRSFMVYPKKGESFVVELDHFEVVNEHFVLYVSRDEAADDRYLSFASVAAIVPAHQHQANAQFTLVLRNGRHLKVWASKFVLEGEAVKFYVRSYGQHEQEIVDIYVALREVVSITPLYNEL